MTPLALWALLTLASYRLWRLAALDTITEPARDALAGDADTGWRAKLIEATWCPWCLGFWCCLVVFGAAELIEPTRGVWWLAVEVAAASTIVGLIGAHADG